VIAAFETASSDPSVALASSTGSTIAESAWTGERGGGHELLPRLIALLHAEGRDMDEVSAIAVGTGPGSFTGLRVGMALAKGLALGLHVPLFGVPSLRAWLDGDPDAEAALARAGAIEAHLLGRGEAAPRIVARDDLTDDLAAGRLVAPRELALAWGLAAAVPPLHAAAAIARTAAERLRAEPAGDSLEALEPLYIRPPRGVPVAAGSG
jgi:tRNA threonylcarbamoyladenosine biosynthesis protein TsaB